MTPQLQRAQDKCATYVQKLDASPYYLAARIFDLENHTAFLKEGDKEGKRKLTTEGEKKLYIIQKLQERFRDKIPLLTVLNKSSKYAFESKENLSVFYKTRQKYKHKKTRLQSQDKFNTYTSEIPIKLDSGTIAI